MKLIKQSKSTGTDGVRFDSENYGRTEYRVFRGSHNFAKDERSIKLSNGNFML